jgi:soluble lytic murein transglycosylase-like protein
MVVFYSSLYNIDPKLALGVIQTESQFNPSAISQTNDVGLFQLNRASFPEYSKEQLLNPEINIVLGINYLVKMKKECKFKDNNEFLVCWNYGLRNARAVKYPARWPYTKKVLVAMKGF